MNLQFNHFKPVLLFLAIFTQCGLAAARYPYQSQQGLIAPTRLFETIEKRSRYRDDRVVDSFPVRQPPCPSR